MKVDGVVVESHTRRILRLSLKWANVVVAVAALSKDRSKKVGAVIFGPDWEIRSTGYNGFARGVNDNVPERHERPEKYKWTVHAEANAIANAARMGNAVQGCTMVVSTLHPCAQCAALIINAGITTVVSPPITVSADWQAEAERARTMFHEAGVHHIFLPVNIDGA